MPHKLTNWILNFVHVDTLCVIFARQYPQPFKIYEVNLDKIVVNFFGHQYPRSLLSNVSIITDASRTRCGFIFLILSTSIDMTNLQIYSGPASTARFQTESYYNIPATARIAPAIAPSFGTTTSPGAMFPVAVADVALLALLLALLA